MSSTDRVFPPPLFPPPLPRPVVHGLRRRILLLVLLLTTLPAAVALVVFWISAAGAVRWRATDEARSIAEQMSVTLETSIQRRMNSLRRLAQSPELLTLSTPVLQGQKSASTLLPLPDHVLTLTSEVCGEGGRIFLLGASGNPLAEIRGGRLAPPPAAVSLQYYNAFPHIPAGDRDTFIAALPIERSTPVLFIGVALRGGRAPEGSFLAALLPTQPFLDEAERFSSPVASQPMILVSRSRGVVYNTWNDGGLSQRISEIREELFAGPPAGQIAPMTYRRHKVVLAFSRTRSLQSLADPSMLPIEWAIVQPVDLDEVLEPLTTGLWTTAFAGIAAVLMASVLASWLSNRLVRPIRVLSQGMQRFALGELDYRVRLRTGDEIEALAESANQMADSLEKSYHELGARLLELDEQKRQLELVHSISHSINRELNLSVLFDRIVDEILSQVPSDRLWLALADESTGQLRVAFRYPKRLGPWTEGTVLDRERSLTARALAQRTLAISSLLEEDEARQEAEELLPEQLHSLCVVPLISSDGVVGAMLLASNEDSHYSSNEAAFLRQLAETLALAIHQCRLYERISHFATELEGTVQRRTEELREAQERLVESEKLAAAGALAANVAHEINNPLSIIKNYLRLASGQLGKQAKASANPDGTVENIRRSLGVVEEEIDRIARIVAQLRLVGAMPKSESAPVAELVDVPEEARALLGLLDHSLKSKSIDVAVEEDVGVSAIWTVRDYLRQILLNLLRNAIDAIEAAQRPSGEIVVRIRHARGSQQGIMLEVEDDGCGIDGSKRGRIFDPFFTTKAEGKGTGLGLSVSYGLARRMGGALSVESEVGVGSVFRLTLPLGERPKTPEPPEHSTGVRRVGGRIIIG
ncbi:MAG: ATP-binding protein [Sumerlaeia bacterium]